MDPEMNPPALGTGVLLYSLLSSVRGSHVLGGCGAAVVGQAALQGAVAKPHVLHRDPVETWAERALWDGCKHSSGLPAGTVRTLPPSKGAEEVPQGQPGTGFAAYLWLSAFASLPRGLR